MEKTVVLTLEDFKPFMKPEALANLRTALRGEIKERTYFLSGVGGVYRKGTGGETEPVTIKNTELYLRLSLACEEAQKGFLEGAYTRLSQQDVPKLFIEVEWTTAGKYRRISAHLFEPERTYIRDTPVGRRRKFFFELAE